MKAFCILPIGPESAPDVDTSIIKFSWNLCGRIAGWGCFLVSGTPAMLTALNALPNTYPICIVTESGNMRWAELNGTIAPAVRTKINTFLTARGYPTIPAGWTYRQMVRAIYQRMNARFEIEAFDLADV